MESSARSASSAATSNGVPHWRDTIGEVVAQIASSEPKAQNHFAGEVSRRDLRGRTLQQAEDELSDEEAAAVARSIANINEALIQIEVRHPQQHRRLLPACLGIASPT